jgi:hypothetical protein
MSELLGNGDGTFRPQATYTIGGPSSFPTGIAAGDFNGEGRDDLAVVNSSSSSVSVSLANHDGKFQFWGAYSVGMWPYAIVSGDFNGDGRTDLATASSTENTVSVLLGNGDSTFTPAGQFVTTPHATPLVTDVNGDGTEDALLIDSAGNLLYRQGVPGQSGTFEPPVIVNAGNLSRDIAWISNPRQGPFLASVDAHDNAVSLYAYRDGGFVKTGSLATGFLPAQVLAADLNGDGTTDLVVRNAGDGSLSVFFPTDPLSSPPAILAGRDHSRGPGCLRRPGGRYNRRRPARPRGHQHADRPAQHLAEPGQRDLRSTPALSRRDLAVRDRHLRLARGHES